MIKPLFFNDKTKEEPNPRKCAEQPWQQAKAEMWDEVTLTLCDLWFLAAHVRLGLITKLQNDYEYVLEELPEVIENKRITNIHIQIIENWKSKIIYFTNELTNEIRNNWERVNELTLNSLYFPEIFEIFKSKEGKPVNATQIQTKDCLHPIRFDKLSYLYDYIISKRLLFSRFPKYSNSLVIQEAFNSSKNGYVHYLAEQIIENNYDDLLIILDNTSLQEHNPSKIIISELESEAISIAIGFVKISPFGKYAISISNSGDKNVLQIFKVNEGIKVKEITFKEKLMCGYFDLSEEKIILGFENGEIKVLDIYQNFEINKGIRIITNSSLSNITTTSDGNIALILFKDKTCILVDLQLQRYVKVEKDSPNYPLFFVLTFCKWFFPVTLNRQININQVSIGCKNIIDNNYAHFTFVSLDLQRIIYCDFMNLELFDINSNRLIKLDDNITFSGDLWDDGIRDVSAVAMTLNSQMCLTGHVDGSLRVWDLIRNECIYVCFDTIEENVVAIDLSFDGSRAICLTENNRIQLFDMKNLVDQKKTGEKVSRLNQFYAGIERGCKINTILPDRKSGKVTLLNNTIEIVSMQNSVDSCCTVSPDGRYVAGTFDCKRIYVWKIKTKGIVNIIDLNYNSEITCILFSPDGGKIIASDRGEENSINIWNTYNDTLLATLKLNTRICGMSGIHASGSVFFGTERYQNGKINIKNLTKDYAIVTGTTGLSGRWCAEEILHYSDEGYEYIKDPKSTLNWDEIYTTKCLWCCYQIPVPNSIIDTIMDINTTYHIISDDFPCLKLPDEAWDEPNLLTICPRCGGKLKFNPFLANRKKK